MPHDYGPYGGGYNGYIHYMQAVEESKKGGRRKPSSGSGCFTLLVFAFAFISASIGIIITII